MAKRKEKDLQNLKAEAQKKFGAQHVLMANEIEVMDVIPTGILALDYATGIGGWPMGYAVGIFGQPDTGKSSILGYAAIASAQAMGLNCAIVMVERKFDPEWATKLGVNCNDLMIVYPDEKMGKDVWKKMFYLVESGDIDLVILDSIGAILSENEVGIDGTKDQVGGQSKLNTWGTKNLAPMLHRNNVCALLINQVRDSMGMHGGQEQPGGWAIKHVEAITVQLRYKSGAGTKYTIGSSDEEVVIGQQMVATLKMNQVAQGTGQRAVFNFFGKETEGYPFGIDRFTDVVNTGIRLGVIAKAGSYYTTPDGYRAQGQNAIQKHIEENPVVLDQIRDGVLTVMRQKAKKPELKAVENE